MHKHFTLNGISFKDSEELIVYSKEISTDLHKFLLNWFDDSEFVTVNTSGTTGKPKEIIIKKQYMVHSAKATGAFFNLPEKTTALLCLPVKFIAGKMMVARALTLGWKLDFIDSSSNPLQDVSKSYDFSAMVPLQLYNSLEKISLIDKLIVGGGAVSKDLINKIQNKATKIFATYGMTETITHIAARPLNYAAGLSENNNFYKALSDVVISSDERRCLVVNAPQVSDGKVVTNDLVEIISDKEFKWLGRYDNIINSGGVKLVPEQIEEKLSKIIPQRFFITSQPDDVLGEKVVMVIEGSNENNLKSQISGLESLTKFERPKEIYFVDRFVETESGKVHRKKTTEFLN
ncbi:MAG: AMP-binding protein [Bacteroidota bacterium]